MAALPNGTSLCEGAYILEEMLGRGGFGITYRALDVRADQFVAVKECFPNGCERRGLEVTPGDFFSASHLESFKRGLWQQAQTLEQLKHPAIVRVLKSFEANNTVYMVMELAEGRSLQAYAEEVGPLPIQEATEWLQPLAGAVTAIHQAGLLHLDIKPENAIVVQEMERRLVLVDFDLVQPREVSDFRTRPLALATQCGTPGYAPLEQYAQHARLVPATDVYALAATFYRLIGGRAPLPAIDRAAGELLVPLSELVPGLPPSVESGVLSALELKPELRPASVEAFLESLRPPPTPQTSDDDYAVPVTPQFVAHTSGMIHRIVLKTEAPELPKRCVCCFERSETHYTLSGPSHRWSLPLCLVCEKHQTMAKQAGLVTAWGIGASLIIALGAVGVSVLTENYWPILLGPAGIMTNFISMNYGGLKNARAEETMRDTCTDLRQPVTHNFNGRVHIWRFKNARYAEEFKKRNAAFVI